MSVLDKLPEQHGPTMTCPDTGLVIPKGLVANLEWRRTLRKQANADLGLRKTLFQACAVSPLFWINAFGWTFHQNEITVSGKRVATQGQSSNAPFITWLCQDVVIQTLRHCIDNGENVLIDKSRDMGASWLTLTMFHWYWQFVPGTTFLEMSRNVDAVDAKGDMDSLFERHRYLYRMQPVWLRPPLVDTFMKLINERNNNALVGESTNQHAGQGGRKTAVLLDEFARVQQAEEIDLSLSDTTSCKIYNSTPQGPHTWFSRLKKSRACRVLELPWFAHPDKSRNAKLIPLEGAEIGYSCMAGMKWSSPWYEQVIVGRSKRDIAMNIDMCHGQAGRTFFDAVEIEKHRAKFEADPLHCGQLVHLLQEERSDVRLDVLKERNVKAIRFVDGGTVRPWSLWCNLIRGRPDQTHAYTLGCDISAGTGSSNSVISVYDATLQQIVAKFVSSTTSPYELAEEAVRAGIWFGGTSGTAVLNWEATGGVGAQFTTQIGKLNYNPCWHRRDITKFNKPKTKKRGWHSTPDTKADLLGLYAGGLESLDIINPCGQALDEALAYVYDDNGRLVAGAAGIDESSGASATHGDHVIADALAFIAREDVPDSQPRPQRIPKNSILYFRQQQKARNRERNPWS